MGLAVTSPDTSTLNDAVLDFWAARTLDPPWQQTDFYTPTQLDFASSGNPAFGGQPGVFVVPGAGTDIWGTVDSFKYVWQDVIPGDATLIARVVADQHTHPFAKAGLMMRNSLNPSAASVILDVKPGGGVEFMVRTSYGAETKYVAGGALALPGWLKLVKSRYNFIAFTSTDGASWDVVGTTSASLSENGAPKWTVDCVMRAIIQRLLQVAVSRGCDGMIFRIDGGRLDGCQTCARPRGKNAGTRGAWISETVVPREFVETLKRASSCKANALRIEVPSPCWVLISPPSGAPIPLSETASFQLAPTQS